MVRKHGIGNRGLAIAAFVMVVMTVVAFILKPDRPLTGHLGLCLPSPNLWEIDPLVSWAINLFLLAVIDIGALFLNRTYNFIRSTDPVLPAFFLILVGSCPWITYNLSTSTLLCGINVLSLAILFRTYKASNATQEMFTIATLLSVGSMFQYAFIPMVIPYIIGAIALKAFRVKELLAFIMGIIAPYWVGIGFGLINPESFRLPEFTNLFSDFTQSSERFVLMMNIALTVFLGGVLALNNSIKLYAGNSRVNAMNATVTVLGIVSILCICLDFSNMMAYLATLFLTVSVQVANMCALWNVRKEWLVLLVPSVIYVALFIAGVLS